MGPRQLCIQRRTQHWGFPQPHSLTLRVAMPVPFLGSRATLDSSKGHLREWVLEIALCDERPQEYNEPQETRFSFLKHGLNAIGAAGAPSPLRSPLRFRCATVLP